MDVPVYTGTWINYSRGPVAGATLTLTSRNGSLLVAALSIFLVAVGSQFWTILSFVSHQLNATKKATDVQHHQHQAILRNAGTSIAAAQELFTLPFAWRRGFLRSSDFRRSVLRSWAWAFLALANCCVWALTGLFSSVITKSAESNVLISPGACGIVYDNSSESGLPTVMLNGTVTADAHARDCYRNNASSTQCGIFVRRQLPWHESTNASCPFRNDVCSATLELDTGYIDSHHDLGINAPSKDRISYRRVTKCAIIDPKVVRNFTTETYPNRTAFPVFEYFFGRNAASESPFTFDYDSYLSISNVGYDLSSIRYYSGDVENSPWHPSEEFYRSDANVELISLFPNFMFSQIPIDDPFFGFHPTNNSTNSTFCLPDNLVNVMACTDQSQLCNIQSQGLMCTPLTAALLLKDEYSKIGLNPTQKATFGLIISSSHEIGASIGGRGTGALLASEKVTRHIQGFLPNNQWMAEVRNWFSIGLVTLQYGLAKYAIGPTSPLPEGVALKAPRTLEGRNLCQSIKVPNPGGYQSFSILGLSTVIVVGGLIIIISVIIQPLAHYAFKNYSMGNDFRRHQWILDGKLQLQRMAYEHVGIGLWANKEGSIPVTMDKAKSFHFDRILAHSTGADVDGESVVRDTLMMP